MDNVDNRTVLCMPSVNTPMRAELDKFRGVTLMEGEYTHPYMGFKVKATKELLGELKDKYNKYRKATRIPTPEGHTTRPSANKGYLDQDSEASIIEVEVNGEKRQALELPYDIKSPDYVDAAKNGTLERSAALTDDYRIAMPDGSIEYVGLYVDHVAYTSYPVVTNMPPMETAYSVTKEMSVKGDCEIAYIPLIDKAQLASRLITWQDPPADIGPGSRKAAHSECGYTFGTPEANCGRCLAFRQRYVSENSEAIISCDWVVDPILPSGVCKYYRPRSYSMGKDKDDIVDINNLDKDKTKISSSGDDSESIESALSKKLGDGLRALGIKNRWIWV